MSHCARSSGRFHGFQVTVLAVLLATSLFAQTTGAVMGGGAVAGGRAILSQPGSVPPPPLPTVQARVFGGIFNSSQPTWPPRDGASNPMQIGTCRLWDGGAKISQLMTVSGPVGNHTYSFSWGPFDSIVQRCKQTNGFTGAPNAPMKVIYTLGSTPCGAALGPDGTYTGGNPPCGEFSSSDCTGTACNCLSPDVNYSCSAYDDNTKGGSSETDKTMITFLVNLFNHAASLGITLDAVELQNEWDTSGFQCHDIASACGSPANNPHTVVNATMNLAMIQRGWDLKALRDCMSPSTMIYSPSSHQATVQPGEIFDNFINSSTTVHALTHGQNGYPSNCPDKTSQTVFGWQVIDEINIHPDGNPSKGPTFNQPESFIDTNNYLECERTVNCTSTGGTPHSGNAFTNLIGMVKTADEFGSKSGDCSSNDCLAAATSRRYIYCAFLGYQDCDYYQLDAKGSFQSLLNNLGGTALDTTANWLIGAVVGTFTDFRPATVFTEPLTSAAGFQEQLMWDTSATDSNGGYTCGANCTLQTVPNGYTFWTDQTDTPHAISNHKVPVGGKPVCVTTNPAGC